MSAAHSRGALAALCLGTVAALALIGSPWQSAATAADEEGRVVDLNPSQGKASAGEKDAERDAEPQYWIGLGGLPITSPILRTQLQLADDVGVAVEVVVPKSPAEKAGLQKHDVLVAIDGEPITDWNSLKENIAQRHDKPLKLKLIRLAKEMTITVTPEERPADQVAMENEPQLNELNLGIPEVNELLKQFGAEGGMRGIGPGMMLKGQALDLSRMPDGVSVSVARDGEGPAKITVKKGDQTWTVEGDDAKALSKLPDDVRPFVQQMLQGPQIGAQFRPNFNFGDLQGALPDQLGRLNLGDRPGAENLREQAEKTHQQMLQRMEEMEERLEDLRRQLHDEHPQTDEPAVSDQST